MTGQERTVGYLLTMRYMMRLVLSSAILQFCRPYRVFAHTRGDSSSPESTMAQSRESAIFNSAHTSADELSILYRVKNEGWIREILSELLIVCTHF